MSLLAPIAGPSIPLNMRVKSETNQVKAAPRRMAEQIVKQWETSFDLLWVEKAGVTPAMRLAELGTDAAELFAANTALVQFLVTMLTGKDDALVAQVLAKVATIPANTIHPDGTVTLD